MLFVLGLLSLRETYLLVLSFALAVWWILFVAPNLLPSLVLKACFLLALWRVLPEQARDGARDDVDEPRTEVENFRVVREGQVVGEARRTPHALVAEVELGSLGKFTFALEPALLHRRAERSF